METATITLSNGIVCARKHFETLLKILNLFWLKTLILHHLPSCWMSYMFEKRHRLLNMCLSLMSLLPGCNENHPACFRVALSQYNQHGLNLVEPLTMSKKPRLGRGKRELPVTQQQQQVCTRDWDIETHPMRSYSYISTVCCECAHFVWTLHVLLWKSKSVFIVYQRFDEDSGMRFKRFRPSWHFIQTDYNCALLVTSPLIRIRIVQGYPLSLAQLYKV